MYHSIADDTDDPYAVRVNSFRDQITWLSDHGFEVITLSSLLQLVQMQSYNKLRKKVVITFDDGYKNFITNALPILLDSGTPATVFIITNLFGSRASWKKFDPNIQLMSEEEVCYIKAQGINLGSHTATHAKLTLLDHDELQRQLKDSREKLIHFGESFHTFSYPFGLWSPQIANAVKAAGYECALAVGEDTRLAAADIYCFPRITMTRDMDMKRFQSRLTRTSIGREIRRRYGAVLKWRASAKTSIRVV